MFNWVDILALFSISILLRQQHPASLRKPLLQMIVELERNERKINSSADLTGETESLSFPLYLSAKSLEIAFKTNDAGALTRVLLRLLLLSGLNI